MDGRDYFSYLLALVSIILAVVGSISKEYRITALLMGSLGICAAIIIIKINEYIKRININTRDIRELKKELNYFKDLQELKQEIALLKNEINKK